ncbi:MAG TPA: cons domain protein, partial [Atlantibacter hermannii]|nr:cons domain protein [Atlantibacter hermannii]
MTTLFQKPLNVISLGLSSFADNLREAGGEV